MARGNQQDHGTGEDGKTGKAAAGGEEVSEKKLSCALQVLRDGLRTLDHAADLIQAALIDLETGTSNSGRASQHLNGVGKILQIKKMQDNAVDSVKKIGKEAGKLPGTCRKFA